MAGMSEHTILSGRYELLGHLGKGGMAYVHHAHDKNLQRDVAIKILRDSLIEDTAFQARFLHEARAAANLAHPNIVTIYDFGYDNGRYFIVMEYVEGTDLKSFILRNNRLNPEEAVDLMIQISAGVGYAHRAGLVHCDLKPQNILVGRDNRVKITDFGIARALASIRPDEYSEIVWGSPTYFAPEQAAGASPSPASDVYALGIILFEMLTGRPPFVATDPVLLAKLHQVAPPPPLRHLNPAISVTLEQIILKVLSKEPSARYRTADQFGRVLSSFARQPQPIDQPIHTHSTDPSQNDHPTHSELREVTYPSPIDWTAVVLGLLAFIAMGGLIPLWLWVCLRYPTCPLNTW